MSFRSLFNDADCQDSPTQRQGVGSSDMSLLILLAATLVALVGPIGSMAQSVDGLSVDLAFPVQAVALQTDGKILIGGDQILARLHPDGTLDESFVQRVNQTVYAIAVQPDGRILVGGGFTLVNGQTHSGLARFNADGTLDVGFNPVADQPVLALSVQEDGRILVGGFFKTLNGENRVSFGRLNADGSVDVQFTPNVGAGWVSSVVSLADRRILVSGAFYSVGGHKHINLARLNLDGSVDDSYNPSGEVSVDALANQPDGKLVVGGFFSILCGKPRSNLGRLNENGTLDESFNLGADGVVYAIAPQADGKNIVGGAFQHLGGVPRNKIARLNSDGTLDLAFNPGANGPVGSIAIQVDGAVVISGGFSQVDGQPRKSVARIGSSVPALHNLSREASALSWVRDGAEPEVWRASFAHSSDGVSWTNLGIGSRTTNGWQLVSTGLPDQGTFRARGIVSTQSSEWIAEDYLGATVIASQPRSLSLRTGSTAVWSVSGGGTPPLTYQWFKGDEALNDTGTITGAKSPILKLVGVQKTDEASYWAVVAGVEGVVTSAVTRLDVIDPFIASQPIAQTTNIGGAATFSTEAGGANPLSYQWRHDGVPLAGATNTSLVLTNLQPSDWGLYSVVVGNQFGQATSAVARLTVNSTLPDTGFLPAADGWINTAAIQTDGKIVVGGRFSSMAGKSRSGLARLNSDGTLDDSFDLSASGEARGLSLGEDGLGSIGGNVTMAAGIDLMGFSRAGTNFGSELRFDLRGGNAAVFTVAALRDGGFAVGGAFTLFDGQPRNYLARVTPAGTVDIGFNPGANGPVRCLGVQLDGKLLIGGTFSSVAGQPRFGIARLNPDGTLDKGFAASIGGTSPATDGTVWTLAVQPDGRILVGGRFDHINGEARLSLARLNEDGTVDTGFDPGVTGSVYCLAIQADRRILVGGFFGSVGGYLRGSVARILPDGAVDNDFAPLANNEVWTLCLQPDGQVFVGGRFSEIGGIKQKFLARLDNTIPATNSLSFDGSDVVWLRGGSAPEVSRVVFDCSIDGVNWKNIGSGIRIPGGWMAQNAAVTIGATLRARGYVRNSGADWITENRVLAAGVPLWMKPTHLAGDDLSVSLIGLKGRVYGIEASGDFKTWIEIMRVTNPFPSISVSLPLETNRQFRFFRAVAP